jgi:long-subunit acyl-CoA synthetase (AMP-forming)
MCGMHSQLGSFARRCLALVSLQPLLPPPPPPRGHPIIHENATLTGAPAAPLSQGLLLAKGPGVMSGYYRDDKATDKAFRAGEGWFDTGDLGWVAPAGVAGSAMGGHLVLTGRAKDTIVLSSGKNVEPQPLEDAMSSSAFIKHIIVVGQVGRSAANLSLRVPCLALRCCAALTPARLQLWVLACAL